MRKILTLVTTPILLLSALCVYSQDIKPYQDDPALIETLKNLPDNTAKIIKRKKGEEGKPSNDYSLKMVYAPERQTAVYAGGNHNNGRRNDCWEYHLGSNSWINLFPAIGGDHYFLKGIMMFKMRDVSKKMKEGNTVTLDSFKKSLNEKDTKELDKIIDWWGKYIVFENGQFTTIKGAPIMPSHTWDGLSYDPIKHHLVWSAGAGPSGSPQLLHSLITDTPFEEIKNKMDPNYTSMWSFDVIKKEWIRYKKNTDQACPDFRGMGQSFVYLPDKKRFIWYVAATNVSPQSFQMWEFDPEKNIWATIKMNGGKSLSELVLKLDVAPPGEQIIRYSPIQNKLYGFSGKSTYSFDLKTNTWEKINTDEKIVAHDAHTGIAYDSTNDVFIYTRKNNSNGLADLAIFDPKTKKWEFPTLNGDKLIKPKYGGLKVFFHQELNVYVVAPGGGSDVWVYRYKNKH